MQKLQNQQAVNTGFLQYTTANKQNTANTSASQYAQLSSNVSTNVDTVTNILNASIAEDLKKSFYNQNLIYNTMESCHQISEQDIASIEAPLATAGMQPQGYIVQSPEPYQVPHQAVLLLNQGAAATGPLLPLVPLPTKLIYKVITILQLKQ